MDLSVIRETIILTPSNILIFKTNIFVINKIISINTYEKYNVSSNLCTHHQQNFYQKIICFYGFDGRVPIYCTLTSNFFPPMPVYPKS